MKTFTIKSGATQGFIIDLSIKVNIGDTIILSNGNTKIKFKLVGLFVNGKVTKYGLMYLSGGNTSDKPYTIGYTHDDISTLLYEFSN